jgi:hypothetical protein
MVANLDLEVRIGAVHQSVHNKIYDLLTILLINEPVLLREIGVSLTETPRVTAVNGG